MASLLEPKLDEPVEHLKNQLHQSGVNLVLLGFPKCGTTAFAEWLDGSRQVAVSRPKETFQLCPEFAANLQRSEQVDLAASFTGSNSLFRVEATTLNVYSSLLREVLRDLPTKVVMIVRDPVESVISWHNQMFQAGTAVSEEFDVAWEYALSHTTQATDGVEFLRSYETICSYGYWVERWIEAVGQERTLLLYDHEVRQNPDALQRRLEAFLGCTLQLPPAVPVRNQFSAVRFPRAYALLRRPAFKSILRSSARYLPIVDTVRRFVRERIMLRPATKKKDASHTMEHLSERFADDQQQLTRHYAENLRRYPG